MAVIRPDLPADGWSWTPRAWLRDPQLDFAAKGMLAYILGHEPGYRLTMEQMIDQSDCGRDAVRRILGDLERAGYLRREKIRDPATGKQLGYDFHLIASTDGLPTAGKPVAGADQAKDPVSAGQAQGGFSAAGSAPPEKTTTEDQGEDQKTDLSGASKSKRGTRVPKGFLPDESMRAWYREEGIGQWVDGRQEHAAFMDYWTGAPGQKGVKVDWPATWRNWMRRARDDAKARRGQRPASDAPAASRPAGGFRTSAEKTAAKNEVELEVSRVFDELAEREGLDRSSWSAVQAMTARARDIVEQSRGRQGNGYTSGKDTIDGTWTEATPREVSDRAA